MPRRILTGLLIAASLATQAAPVDTLALQPKEEAQIYKSFNRQLDSIDKKLEFKSGQILLANGKIRMTVPEDFLFIEGEQARYILEDLWGNYSDGEVCGMLVKKGFKVTRLINDFSFVISYADLGYVQDKKDIELNHDELLATLRQNMEISNERRIANGVNTMQVEKWALVPYFDNYKKAVYWANSIKVNGTDEEILNYNLRLLGRSGVIKINAVATMDQFPAIKQILPQIISQVRFPEGQQYADYVAATDKTSSISIRELIAGQSAVQSHSSGWQSWKLLGILAIIGVLSFSAFSNFKTKRPVAARA